MIVVDTNILAYLLLASECSVEAERALRKDPVWAAPLLWRSELRNVLTLYMRERGMTAEQAAQVIDTADELLQGREYAPSWSLSPKVRVRPTIASLSPWPRSLTFRFSPTTGVS